MVFFNYTTMHAAAKIVYYGPGLGGKTTNLLHIHKKTAAVSRGEMVSLETDTDRTLFFDLLPLEVGTIGGMRVRLQLYTVPGQVFYNATRRLVLRGVDGVVFVADSQKNAFDANLESLRSLEENLGDLGLSPETLPLVFQYNKRDLRSILTVDELERELNPGARPFLEAAALHGVGVFETLKAISRLALSRIHDKIARPEEEVRATTAPPASVPLEFAEAGEGGASLRPVRIRSAADIHREIELLRSAIRTPAAPRPSAEPHPGRTGRRLEEILNRAAHARREVRRKAELEVPEELLKPGASVRLALVLNGPDGAVTLPTGIEARLPDGEPTERLVLHAEIGVRAKPRVGGSGTGDAETPSPAGVSSSP